MASKQICSAGKDVKKRRIGDMTSENMDCQSLPGPKYQSRQYSFDDIEALYRSELLPSESFTTSKDDLELCNKKKIHLKTESQQPKVLFFSNQIELSERHGVTAESSNVYYIQENVKQKRTAKRSKQTPARQTIARRHQEWASTSHDNLVGSLIMATDTHYHDNLVESLIKPHYSRRESKKAKLKPSKQAIPLKKILKKRSDHLKTKTTTLDQSDSEGVSSGSEDETKDTDKKGEDEKNVGKEEKKDEEKEEKKDEEKEETKDEEKEEKKDEEKEETKDEEKEAKNYEEKHEEQHEEQHPEQDEDRKDRRLTEILKARLRKNTKSISEEDRLYFLLNEAAKLQVEGDGSSKKIIKLTRTDLIDYRDLTHSGYFRDQKRRIDIVIVIDDTNHREIEIIKEYYLQNCMGAGLDLELESGVAHQNKDLVFIKVHGPDTVILALAAHFGYRKYFRANHLELMRETCLDERNIIKCVRRGYPGPFGWSTIERITVIYRLLRLIPFGPPENYIGIDRLVAKGIVRDVYPLHDGPYFILDNNYYKLNGRQALHENWVGYENVLRRQPIHMIREYLGERIAFLFAFFEFYNRFLVYLWVVGMLYFAAGYFSDVNNYIVKSACTNQTYKFPHWFTETVWLTWRYTYTWVYDMWERTYYWGRRNISYDCRTWGWKNRAYTRWKFCPYNYQTWIIRWTEWTLCPNIWNRATCEWSLGYWPHWAYTWTSTFSKVAWRIGMRSNYKITVYYDLPICPKCKDFRACPFMNMTNYCIEVQFKTLLDNAYNIYGAAFVVFWCILFYLKWNRREHYLYWLWETAESEAVKFKRYEFVQKIDKIKMLYSIKAASILILPSIIILVTPILTILQEKTQKKMNYYYKLPTTVIKGCWFNHAMISALFGFFVIGFQLFGRKVAFSLNRMIPNTKTEKPYELSIAIMIYGFYILSNLSLPIFYTFIKGVMYTHPADENRWFMAMGLGFNNCGIGSCIDEAFIVLVASQLAKNSFLNFDQIFHTQTTEFMVGNWWNQNVPCWEKELDLMSFTEADVMKKFNFIFVQLTVTVCFFWFCPIGGFIFFLANYFEIRYWAKEFLLHSRRPLPLKTWSLGGWRIILMYIPYIAAIFNIVAIVRLSNVVQRTFHKRHFHNIRYFMDFTMAVFNTSDFYNTSSTGGKTGNFTDGTPAGEWEQYMTGYYDRRLYPHWMQADFCMFPNMYNRRYQSHKLMRVYENSYMPNLNYWYTMWSKVLVVIIFEQLAFLLTTILNISIGSMDELTRATIDIENVARQNKIRDAHGNKVAKKVQ